jgi:hypothetical protein
MMPRLLRQRGTGMLEMLAVIVLGAMLAGAVLVHQERAWQDTRALQAGVRQATLSGAVQRYLRAHGALVAARANGTRPYLLPIDELATAGYLPPGWSALNAWGQDSCVVLTATATGLDALVLTSGGLAIDAAMLPALAARAGPGGGAITDEVPAQARGAYGSWRLDAAALQRLAGSACNGTPPASGHLASLLHQGLGGGADDPGFLARDGAAATLPVNVLNTPLALGGLALATAGSACGTSAAIALDAERALLTCAASGVWQKNSGGGSWKEAAANYDALPKTDSPGDVRIVTNMGRAFVRNAKGGWPGLAADRWGALDVPGTVQANNLAISLHINIGENTPGGGNLQAGRDVNIGNDLQVTHAVRARNMVARDWFVTPSKHFHLGRPVVQAGAACNLARGRIGQDGAAETLYPIGTMLADPQGITLSCQSPGNIFLYNNGKMTP